MSLALMFGNFFSSQMSSLIGLLQNNVLISLAHSFWIFSFRENHKVLWFVFDCRISPNPNLNSIRLHVHGYRISSEKTNHTSQKRCSVEILQRSNKEINAVQTKLKMRRRRRKMLLQRYYLVSFMLCANPPFIHKYSPEPEEKSNIHLGARFVISKCFGYFVSYLVLINKICWSVTNRVGAKPEMYRFFTSKKLQLYTYDRSISTHDEYLSCKNYLLW